MSNTPWHILFVMLKEKVRCSQNLQASSIRGVILFLFVSFALVSCNKSEEIEPYSLSLDKAVKYFEESVNIASTKSSEQENTGVFYLGNITPDWSGYEINHNYYTGFDNVETTISSGYKYRVIQRDSKRTRYTNCYQKLIVSEDADGERHGVCVVFFIPTNEYDWGHKKNIEKKFGNDGDMGDYSGLKLYCTLQGKIYRINQYKDGKKIGGLFFPDIKTEEQYRYAVGCLNGWFGNMSFQRGMMITRSTCSLDVESDGYAYSDMGEIFEPASCIADWPFFSGDNDWTRDFLDDLLESQLGEDDDSFYDQDDFHGCDGAGESVVQSEKIEWKVGEYTITITCVDLSEDDLKHLKDQLEKLSKLPVVQRLVKLLEESKVSLTIKACSKSDRVFQKYMNNVVDISGITKSKPKRGEYSTVEINLNATDGNYIGYLEELFHAWQFGRAEDKPYTWDLEFEAKIFLGSLIGSVIDRQEFVSFIASNNADNLFVIYKYARLGDGTGRSDAYDAMVRMDYSVDKNPSRYFLYENMTLEEKNAADKWAHKLFQRIEDIF